ILRGTPDKPYPVEANPFLGRSTEFIMKRMVRLAAQGGYDAIIWPGSEEQTARYNGRARHEIFAGIEWRASLEPDRVIFDLVTELGNTILSDEAKIDDLSKYLPEKYVDQIRRDRAEGFVEDYIEFPENERREIASKGMRVHYDTRLPAIAKKIGKRFGARPRQFQLRFADKVPLYQVMYNENVVAEVDSTDLADFIVRELISAAED